MKERTTKNQQANYDRRAAFNARPETPSLRRNLAAFRLPDFTAAQHTDRVALIRRKFAGMPNRIFPRRVANSPGGMMLRMGLRGSPILFATFLWTDRPDIIQVARLSDAVAYYFRDYRRGIAHEGGEFNFSESQAQVDCEYEPLRLLLDLFKHSLDSAGFLNAEKLVAERGNRLDASVFNRRCNVTEKCVNALDAAVKRLEDSNKRLEDSNKRLESELSIACARIQTLEKNALISPVPYKAEELEQTPLTHPANIPWCGPGDHPFGEIKS